MAEEGEEKRGKFRYGPGRRPILNYEGSRGWQQRIYIPTVAAGIIGGGAGILSGILKHHGTSKLAITYAVNSAIVASCFCDMLFWRLLLSAVGTLALIEPFNKEVYAANYLTDEDFRETYKSVTQGSRELVRELRAAEPEDPINSVLGGIASGGFLGRIQGGRPRAFYYAFLFATVGTGLQLGTLKLQEYLSHKNLESSSPDTAGEVESSPSEKKWWAWPEWAPIQKLDEEAAAKRAQERDIQIQRTLDKLKKGDSL